MAFYKQLVESGEAAQCGVGFIDGWGWSHDAEQYDGYGADVPMFRVATPAELKAQADRTGEAFLSGVYWRSVIVDSPVYLRWLMADIEARGGRFVDRRVESLEELRPHFDIVVNAAGMRARELAPDADCHAYRGQVIRVFAPHVTEFVTASTAASSWHAAYVLPRPTSGVITCGGTYERDREFVGIDPRDSEHIWEKCCKLVPGLRDPRTVRIDEWTGLRPGRDGDVRIQLEEAVATDGSAAPLFIVHAYGHGGCGHSLGWGTALRAAQLVGDAAAKASETASRRERAPFAGEPPVLSPSIHVLFPALMRQQAAEQRTVSEADGVKQRTATVAVAAEGVVASASAKEGGVVARSGLSVEWVLGAAIGTCAALLLGRQLSSKYY